jgi:hypothetical protein
VRTIPPSGIRPLFNCATYPTNQTLTIDQIMQRAQSWVDEHVPYSESACHNNIYGNYRTDCSGFVSMAWGLTHSLTTEDFDPVSTPISRTELRAGDALIKPGEHMGIFQRWSDDQHTKPVMVEETQPGSYAQQDTWSASYAALFAPIRYINLIDNPPPDEDDIMPTFSTHALPEGFAFHADGTIDLTKVLELAVPPANGGALPWGGGWLSLATDLGTGPVTIRLATKADGQAWGVETVTLKATDDRHVTALPTNIGKITIARVEATTGDPSANTPVGVLLEYGHR